MHKINNKHDYEVALATIESLWDATPGTSKGDRLDALIKLVEGYELKNHPVSVPDQVASA